ncbi:MAG: SAF domain-containing protein [Myxococcales bacterium]|jgi:Flp pilus assembly protein CpaB
MKRLLPILLLAATGCVSASTFEKLKAEHATSLKRLEQSDAALASCSRRTISEQEIERLKKSWTLVPVVVANQDLAEGTVIAYDMVSQRPLPEQFVTTSVVKPDSASYIIGQKTLVPMQAGDMFLWSMFETSKAAEQLSKAVTKDRRIFTIETTPASSCGEWIRRTTT